MDSRRHHGPRSCRRAERRLGRRWPWTVPSLRVTRSVDAAWGGLRVRLA